MQNLLLFQVDAFTDHLFGGNPAAVIPLGKFLDDDTMQSIARENNLSETAFVVPAGEAAFHIRWFTPNKEVRLCGHATLAAAHVLFSNADREIKELTFHTGEAGDLSVKRKKKGNYVLDFPADRPKKAKTPSFLSHALGAEPEVVLRGADDLLVVISKESQLRKLKPNLELLKKVKKRGVIVTAPGKKEDFVSRCFYPRFGISEDPVTGSAHTLLTPYWAKRLNKRKMKAAQISERRGDLGCQLKGNRVLLSGEAVTYLTGEVRL